MSILVKLYFKIFFLKFKVILNADGSVTQIQALCRNGYRPGHHTIPRQSKSAAHLHHNQQHHNQHLQNLTSNIISGPSSLQPTTNFGVNASLAYTLQNMSLVDVHNSMLENNIISSNRHKSGGSDSGSSIGSTGDVSPPDTPTINSSNSVRLNDQSNFSKQVNLTRINGRPDKLISGIGGGSGGGGGGGNGTATVIYAPTTNSPQQQQQQQQFVGNEIILTTGPNLMPSPVTNNNSLISSTGNSGSSSNNNLVTSTVLITSPSTITGGVGGNVITSNPVILQQQQQFSATYPYHPQHLTATTRPPILSHNPAIVPPATFRHPGFQIQPNGDILYPYPPQVAAAAAAGITFLQPSGAPPPQVVRTSPSASVPTSLPPPPPQQQQTQQQQQQPSQIQQQTHQPPNAALLTVSPYTTLTIGGNKLISCFNCGSQSHTGRECQEASMEDVTRGSIYKLDYSSSISPGNTTNIGGGSGGGNNISTNNGGNSVTTVEIATETSSPTSSSSSLSNSNNK